MVEVITVGVDLAKNVFQLHGVDETGRPVLRRQLRRSQMLEFFQRLPGCLVGMKPVPAPIPDTVGHSARGNGARGPGGLSQGHPADAGPR
jgi:hypothetical protein